MYTDIFNLKGLCFKACTTSVREPRSSLCHVRCWVGAISRRLCRLLSQKGIGYDFRSSAVFIRTRLSLTLLFTTVTRTQPNFNLPHPSKLYQNQIYPPPTCIVCFAQSYVKQLFTPHCQIRSEVGIVAFRSPIYTH
jgi:hypothetical protein